MITREDNNDAPLAPKIAQRNGFPIHILQAEIGYNVSQRVALPELRLTVRTDNHPAQSQDSD